jgi:hypothetical protein
MSRYFTRPAGWFEYMPDITAGEAQTPAVTVFGESAPIKTGLLDHEGHDIYRDAERIGFLRSK